jgi:branched-chain amino acid transport system permease protein
MVHLLQVVFSGLSVGAVYALTALGFGIVHRGTGAVNFAQGEYVMVGGVVAGVVHEAFAPPLLVTILVGLAAGALVGLATHVVGVHFTPNPTADGITVATIGVAIAIKAGMTIVTNRRTFGMPSFTGDAPISVLGAALNPQTLWNLALVGVAATALALFFRRTRRGIMLQAVADDAEIASAFGVSYRGATAWSFGLAGVSGALAGLALTPLTLISFDSGTLLGLKGFAAAMLGGLGSMPGALAGGLVLGLSEAFFAGYGYSNLADVVAFVILLVVLFVRPSGIFATTAVERV